MYGRGASPLPPSLAIIAGGGVFPDLVAEQAASRGCSVFGVCLKGHAGAETLAAYDRVWASPEQMGRIFKELRARNISDMVLIGRMRRPRLFSLRPDLATLCLLPRIVPALCFKGDDALLRAVRGVLESRGFRLHGADRFLEMFMAGAGPMGRVVPTPLQMADISLGAGAACALGMRDIGQAVVVHAGRVIGQETIEGTDALICGTPASGGILVKMCKPQQDRALDMPSLGPETLKRCLEAGYAGIAVEANATLMASKKEMIDFADAHGLFLVGIT